MKQEKRGILLKPKHEQDTTKFKLWCVYDRKVNGIFFTDAEKKDEKNLKYHDSIDFILTTQGNVTRHDLAHEKLLEHLKYWDKHIVRALMFMNDFTNDKQYLIGRYEQNRSKNQFIQPEFTHYQKVFYKEEVKQLTESTVVERAVNVNSVFCTGLLMPALDVFKLKRHKTL